jgi:SAM-dependent methyltransferase
MFVPSRLRRRFVDLRTEGAGTLRETTAVALGAFIGCLPVYGFHLLICWTLGYVLGLNRLKMYVAANISNPFVAPWLVFAEVQAGAWLRRGSFHPLTLAEIETTGVAVFGIDVLVGSVFVGSALAALAAAGTYAVLRTGGEDAPFAELVRRAADRYAGTSITAWEFARGKLRGDPVYRATLSGGMLTGGPLLDIGCGQGLALSLLAEARRSFQAGTWPPGWARPPQCEPMIGIETRRRAASLARDALAGDAEIIEGDARTLSIDRVSAVLLFDVLHLMSPDEQETLLAALAIRLLPGGVVLVRDVDASAGWRFTTVWLINRIKAIVLGMWRQSFHARTENEWRACFERCGFHVEVWPMAGDMPFANVLFRLTAKAGAAVPVDRAAATS